MDLNEILNGIGRFFVLTLLLFSAVWSVIWLGFVFAEGAGMTFFAMLENNAWTTGGKVATFIIVFFISTLVTWGILDEVGY